MSTATGNRHTLYDGTLKLGRWIQTASGKKFHFNSSHPEEVDIQDIAVTLSRMPRWVGHTADFMSVSQHCVLTSILVKELGGTPQEEMMGLLHDATEGYMCDIPKPLKNLIPLFKEIEDKVWTKISKHFFGKALDLPLIVHHADGIMLATEARDLFAFPPLENWVKGCPPPWEKKIKPVGPKAAHTMFLKRYEELTCR
jgi:uncharacterized protein